MWYFILTNWALTTWSIQKMCSYQLLFSAKPEQLHEHQFYFYYQCFHVAQSRNICTMLVTSARCTHYAYPACYLFTIYNSFTWSSYNNFTWSSYNNFTCIEWVTLPSLLLPTLSASYIVKISLCRFLLGWCQQTGNWWHAYKIDKWDWQSEIDKTGIDQVWRYLATHHDC